MYGEQSWRTKNTNKEDMGSPPTKAKREKLYQKIQYLTKSDKLKLQKSLSLDNHILTNPKAQATSQCIYLYKCPRVLFATNPSWRWEIRSHEEHKSSLPKLPLKSNNLKDS